MPDVQQSHGPSGSQHNNLKAQLSDKLSDPQSLTDRLSTLVESESGQIFDAQKAAITCFVDQLQAAAQQLSGSNPVLVKLEGLSGIGKSTLLRAIESEFHDTDVNVVTADYDSRSDLYRFNRLQPLTIYAELADLRSQPGPEFGQSDFEIFRVPIGSLAPAELRPIVPTDSTDLDSAETEAALAASLGSAVLYERILRSARWAASFENAIKISTAGFLQRHTFGFSRGSGFLGKDAVLTSHLAPFVHPSYDLEALQDLKIWRREWAGSDLSVYNAAMEALGIDFKIPETRDRYLTFGSRSEIHDNQVYVTAYGLNESELQSLSTFFNQEAGASGFSYAGGMRKCSLIHVLEDGSAYHAQVWDQVMPRQYLSELEKYRGLIDQPGSILQFMTSQHQVDDHSVLLPAKIEAFCQEHAKPYIVSGCFGERGEIVHLQYQPDDPGQPFIELDSIEP